MPKQLPLVTVNNISQNFSKIFSLPDYELQVSYGTAIIMANVMYTANVIWDKNVTDFTAVDWGTIAANTGYAWGYSGLWLVDGQLESPDPGCGLQVIICLGICHVI